MPRFRVGTVRELLAERPGLQRVVVAHDGGEERRAYALTELTGPVAPGDRVVVNTTAVDLGLGTGGWDVVHWNLARTEGWGAPGPGHVLKLRYTSLQTDTGVAEEHEGYAAPDDLGGRPVVACALHSQLACVAAVVKHLRPTARVAYVMTDAGALPLALSDLVHGLRGAGLLDVTVTAGHAFGGDHEAVNLTSALDVAVASGGADVVVAGTGPGVVGTGTRHGFSGLEVAAIVDAVSARGGTPVVALRVSDADARGRHRGISHHSRTALRQARTGAIVPIPAGEERPAVEGHEVVAVEVPDVPALLAAAGLQVTTMGRGPDSDPRFFAYAGAAGAFAARRVGAS